METELRLFWDKLLSFNWKFGLLVILTVCIQRFLLVLNPNTAGNYSFYRHHHVYLLSD
jgi:hypothetical protein